MTSGKCFSQGLMSNIMSRIHFGLKAGANYSDYTNASFGTEGLVGFHAGALVDFRITHSLSIQEEFLFSSQGAKLKDGQLGTGDLHIYYMSVPFLLKYRLPMGLYLEAGPQVGMRLKEELDHSSLDNFAKRLDLCAAAGIGYQTSFGLGIGARYVGGISKVGDFKSSDLSNNFRTNMVQASVFYIF